MATPSDGGDDRQPTGLEGIRCAASAPAKCILLGEHAVVYGEPCLSLAMDRRTRVVAHRVGDRFVVNGYPLSRRHHAFVMGALRRVGQTRPVRFEVDSDVPSASGLGSSAALCVATVASLHRLHQAQWDPPRIAQEAYDAEREAQGGGSPNDTSVSTAGGTVFLSSRQRRAAGLSPLWPVRHGEATWFAHRAPTPRFPPGVEWVVGHTGVHASTRAQVGKVARFVRKGGFGKDTVRGLGELAWQGLDALRDGDPEAFGRTMDRAHSHLVTLGASHPALERLVEGARRAPGTLGAKLTGAGGGGAMLVLTRDAARATAALRGLGARTLRFGVSLDGARKERAGPEVAWDETMAGTPEPGAGGALGAGPGGRPS